MNLADTKFDSVKKFPSIDFHNFLMGFTIVGVGVIGVVAAGVVVAANKSSIPATVSIAAMVVGVGGFMLPRIVKNRFPVTCPKCGVRTSYRQDFLKGKYECRREECGHVVHAPKPRPYHGGG